MLIAPGDTNVGFGALEDEYLAHIVDQRCPAGVCLMDGGRSRAAAPGSTGTLPLSTQHTATVADGRPV